MSENTRKDRITVRLTPSQMQVLKEIKDALGVSYSMLTRTIILQFLQQNEEALERIIDNYEKTGEHLVDENLLITNSEEYDN